jgi:hypothetical protein
MPSAPPGAGSSAMPGATSSTAVLTSTSLQITGLRSIAVTTVTAAAGTVKVIQLQMTASTINGLDLQEPCDGHVRIHVTAGQDRASGGVTIDATALQVTVLGVHLPLAASGLPAGQLSLPGVSLPPLPTDLSFLTVTLFVAEVVAGAMSLSGVAQSAAGC